jgi:hypothetical protein
MKRKNKNNRRNKYEKTNLLKKDDWVFTQTVINKRKSGKGALVEKHESQWNKEKRNSKTPKSRKTVLKSTRKDKEEIRYRKFINEKVVEFMFK